MQWAHPNVLAASLLNYGSGLTQSIRPYFLLMGPSGLSQNHGSNCTWVLLTTTTCSVSWAQYEAPGVTINYSITLEHVYHAFCNHEASANVHPNHENRSHPDPLICI